MVEIPYLVLLTFNGTIYGILLLDHTNTKYIIKMGAHVDVVHAYKTIKPEYNREDIIKMFQEGTVHMVTFTSSSTVENFVEMFDSARAELRDCMKSVAIACIGPITADTARENQMEVTVVPPNYTIEALTKAVVEYFNSL